MNPTNSFEREVKIQKNAATQSSHPQTDEIIGCIAKIFVLIMSLFKHVPNDANVLILRRPAIPRPRQNAPSSDKKKGPEFLSARIRATELRLITEEGTDIVSREKAEALAEETGLDLLVVSLESSPPVIRLIDYGKFKYEQEKKQRIAKKKQHVTEIKEVKMTVRIDDHDYGTKLNRAKKFLEQADKVKLSIRLKGREIQHNNLALDLAKRFVGDLKDEGSLDGRIQSQGRLITCVLSPNKK